jgi:hypothetical protein
LLLTEEPDFLAASLGRVQPTADWGTLYALEPRESGDDGTCLEDCEAIVVRKMVPDNRVNGAVLSAHTSPVLVIEYRVMQG